MAVKHKGKYICLYCKTVYDDEFRADRCRDKHELIYVPISKSDLNMLIHFLYMKDDSMLTETLVNTLTAYSKSSHSSKMLRYEKDLDDSGIV